MNANELLKMMPEEVNKIDTEAQRLALEEMSQQLLDRMNAMVAEQERRAADFAARTHSLSPLPEVAPLPEVEPVNLPAAPEQEPAPAVRSVPPPVALKRPPTAEPQKPTPPPSMSQAAPARQAQDRRKQHDSRADWPTVFQPQGEEEEKKSAIGPVAMFIIFAVIYVMLRACSN